MTLRRSAPLGVWFASVLPATFAVFACSSNGTGDDDSPVHMGTGEDSPTGDSQSDDTTPAVEQPDQKEATAGGQSGGQTSAPISAPYPCACLNDQGVVVRASVVQAAGGCVELEVLEVYGDVSDLEAGDRIGGAASPLCYAVYFPAPEFLAGDEVIAVYSQGGQASNECEEYQACSLEQCGPFPEAEPGEPDPDCVAAREAGSGVDCPPGAEQPVDEQALLQWDACDGQCAVDTRDACEAHADEARLGGRVSMARLLDGDQLQYEWAGEVRNEPLEQSFAPECQDDLNAQFQEHFERATANRDRTEQTTQAAPPPEEAAQPVCPVPR